MENGLRLTGLRSRGVPQRRTRSSRSSERADLGSDFWYVWKVLRRRWWLILTAIAVSGTAFYWSQRDRVDRYTAEVLLERRPEAPVVGSAAPLQNAFRRTEFASEVEIIRSRAVLAPVVDSLGLQLRVSGRNVRRSRLLEDVQIGRDMRPRSYRLERSRGSVLLVAGATGDTVNSVPAGDTLVQPGFRLTIRDEAIPGGQPVFLHIVNRQAAVERLRSRLRIEQGKGPNLIWLRLTDTDPAFAAEVVNTIAESYRRHRAQEARNLAGRRREVISEQLVKLADSLRDVQGEVEQYQEQATLLDPAAQGSAALQAMFRTEDKLRELRFKESRLEALVAEVDRSREADSAGATFGRLMSLSGDLIPSGDQLYSRLRDLQDRRSSLTASRYGRTENSPEVAVVDSLIATTRAQMEATARVALEQLRAQIQSTEERLAELKREVGNMPARSSKYTRLQQRASAVQEVFDLLVEKYYEAQIAEGVETGNVEIVDPAPVPLHPDPHHGRLYLTISLLIGAVVGGLGAFGLESLDTNIRSAGEAEAAAGLQVIGAVPKYSPTDREEGLLATEAFRGIRTNLLLASNNGSPGSIAVTSSLPREGKSTISVNLARAFARQGSTVILVDADLRSPEQHKFLGIDRSPGLTDVLRGDVSVFGALTASEELENLSVMPAGSPTSSAAELLGGERFTELVGELLARSDFVIFDTCPTLAVTDASLVCARCERTLLVVRSNHTRREFLEKAVDQLSRVGASIDGVLLNAVPRSRLDGEYGYAKYASEYGVSEDEGAEISLLPKGPEGSKGRTS